MNEVATDELRKAVEALHRCKATYRRSEPVREEFRGETVWEGVVHEFAITNHATAKTCYAWSAEVPATRNRQFFAVLGIGPIQTARDAVRASIVGSYRDEIGDAK